ncbi:hypothetical protein SpCBS45565_g00286 [Spizellomyces sp. 'palustris']|nr:hypothetical protein SpCBS45565_g00286 [Spizellomyces sp. 'palustris']
MVTASATHRDNITVMYRLSLPVYTANDSNASRGRLKAHKEFKLYWKLKRRPPKLLQPQENVRCYIIVKRGAVPCRKCGNRVQRLKDARTEAQKEIEALKAQKNKDFADFEKQYTGSTDDIVSKANADTETQLKEVTAAYNKNKAQVVEKLLSGIVNVQPQVHPNAKRAA